MYNSEKKSEIQSRRWRMAHEYGKETLSKEDEQIWFPTCLDQD